MTGKRSPRRRKTLPPLSLGGVHIEEELPYPVVHYPNRGGAFFAFSYNENAEPYLCECSREALENLMNLNKRFPPASNANPLREAAADSFNVPEVIAKISAEIGPEVDIDSFNFKRNLCHRCNLVPPTRRCCLEMYGGKFLQNFGWYVSQTYFRLGIKRGGLQYLDEVCPKDYKSLISEVRKTGKALKAEEARINELVFGPDRDDIGADEVVYMHNVRFEDAETLIRLRRENAKPGRELKNKVENIVRQEFGFRKVGEGWVSETLLYQVISRIYPDEDIVRHHRPEWLNGLELDIYLPRLNLGIEYQGQQHYHPIAAWGGESALKALQERDDRKKKLCSELGVKLVEIDYTEPLTYDYIKNRVG